MKQVFVGIAALLIGVSCATAKEYNIKLARTQKVGQKFQVNASGEQVQKMVVTMNGQPMQNQDTDDRVAMDAVKTILAVNEKQQSTKAEYKIKKLVSIKADGETSIVPEGTVIVVTKNGGETTYTVDGKPADMQMQTKLPLVIDVEADENGDNDEIFGTTMPQELGGTWPVNKDKIVAGMIEQKMEATAENVEGSGKLVSIKKVNGEDSMEVVINTSITQFRPPLPPTFTIEEPNMSVKVTAVYPLDISKQASMEKMEMNMSFTGKMDANGAKMEMTATTAMTQTVTTKEL